MHLMASLDTSHPKDEPAMLSTNEMIITHISKIIYIELIMFDVD